MPTDPPCDLEVYTYADEHENGQLRIAVAGEQVSLLPLPDELIPDSEPKFDNAPTPD